MTIDKQALEELAIDAGRVINWNNGRCLLVEDFACRVTTLVVEVEKAMEAANAAPIPMRLPCPKCGELHIDEGEFETKVHHTHSCQHCGLTWRPAIVATVGVRFLPGFKDEHDVDWKFVLPHQLVVKCAECESTSNAPAVHGYTFAGGEWRCAKHSAGANALVNKVIDNAVDKTASLVAETCAKIFETWRSEFEFDEKSATRIDDIAAELRKYSADLARPHNQGVNQDA